MLQSVGSQRVGHKKVTELNYQLTNLFNTLKRDPVLNSPHSLSQETRKKVYLYKMNYNSFLLTLD